MSSRIYKIILFFVTFVIIIIGSARFLGVSYKDTKTSSYAVDFSEEELFSSISIDGRAMDITIKPGHNRVEYDGREEYMPSIDIVDQVLTIKQKKTPKLSGKGHFKLTVYVSDDVQLHHLDVNVNAADVDIDEINATEANIVANAGDFDVNHCAFDKINVSTNAGDITFAYSTFNNLSVNTNAGDIKIRNLDSVDDYSINANVSLGDIRINGKKVGNSHQTTSSKGKSIVITNNLGDISISE